VIKLTIENPFSVDTAEDIPFGKFKDLFVKERTWINALETPKDFFILGTRGSGKSMLLNYLEFSHQLYYFENNLSKFLEMDRHNKYIGIMVHILKKNLDTDRYELLKKNKLVSDGFVAELCMHDLVMAILYKTLFTFKESEEMAKYINSLDSERITDFCEKELKEFDKQRKIYKIKFDKNLKNTEILNEMAEIFLEERTAVKYYIIDKFQNRNIEYGNNYSNFEYMNNFILNLRKTLYLENFSFYFLLDNADQTKDIMQLSINNLIKQRFHENICFKVAVDKSTIWNKEPIQWPHDYSQIDIDELYSSQHRVYSNRIKEIAKKRLELHDVIIPLEEFFPESPDEKKLLERIKRDLRDKYDQEYEKELVQSNDLDRYELPEKNEYIINRISKNAQTELFRQLRKTPKSYAGLNNIIHLSSGIIRQFLDICARMFEEEMKVRGDVPFKQISLQTQKDVIRKYADDFIDELIDKFKKLEEEGNNEKAKKYRGLYNLIEALGKCYRERLLDPKIKESRIFTFTLKDPYKYKDVEEILEIGVNGRGLSGIYFQTYWYSAKAGYGKYPAYAFNRRLCPRYGIDFISFRGRIELRSADLRAASELGELPRLILSDEDGLENISAETDAIPERKEIPFNHFIKGDV
jgi:hypothetical protein